MPESKIEVISKEIKFSSDDFVLKGMLHLPAIEHPPVVIGCHGLFSTSDSPKQIALAQKCAESGIAYFRFDHRGCGESEGVFGEVTSLDARCKDLKSAVKMLKSMDELGEIIGFFGSSFGGTVCISVAKSMEVAALVTYAAPIHSRTLIQPTIDKFAELNPGTPSIDVKKLQFNISGFLPEIRNILIFHGDSDKVVPPCQAWEIFSKSGSPKRLIFQRNGDHPMSNPEDQERFVRESVVWFKTTIEGKTRLIY